jgi:hypothetical protein
MSILGIQFSAVNVWVRAGTAQSIQMIGYKLESRVRFPVVERDFFLLHSAQTGTGGFPVFYPMGTEGYFPGSKAAGW